MWPERSTGRARRPAGDGGRLSARSGRSPTVAWRPGKVGSKRVAPSWILPRARMKGRAHGLDSTLASDAGTFPMIGGWTAPPELTAERALEAALNSGKMLARHQQDSGRFAYTVKGPSGRIKGKGYNFPRHAGTTWFLARLAQRTEDPEMWAATHSGLKFMAENTIHMDDGRAYLGDPRRSDGKAWVGTTALAVLAAIPADHHSLPWGRFIASSVDEHGQVRGEMKRSKGCIRSEEESLRPGADDLGGGPRARAAPSSPTPWPASSTTWRATTRPAGGRLFILDEHWTCLAALAIQDVTEEPTGADICRLPRQGSLQDPHYRPSPRPQCRRCRRTCRASWLVPTSTRSTVKTPSPTDSGSSRISTKRATAAAAEAARAAGRLRDNPYRLDVRMDAVQHIGSRCWASRHCSTRSVPVACPEA